jgi:predicted GIY-YIG superfamily endonuclease
MSLASRHASGVYAIYNQQRWIYFGESNDLQRRLLEHLNNAGSCILNNAPNGFMFEVNATEAGRTARQNALILALSPACNQTLG